MSKADATPDLSIMRGRVQRGMNARGMRAAAVGREANVDPSKLSRFLSGERKTESFDMGELARIARVLHLRLDWVADASGQPWLDGWEFPDVDPKKADGRSDKAKAKPGPVIATPAELEETFLPSIDERYRQFAKGVIQASQAHPATKGFPLQMRWETLQSMAAKTPMAGHTSAEWFHFFKVALLEGPGVRVQLVDEDEDRPTRPKPPAARRRRGASS